MTAQSTPHVLIRPAAPEDAADLAELLSRNRDYFRSGEPVRPDSYYTVDGQRRLIEEALRGRDLGTGAMFLIRRDGAVVGRISLNSIVRGAFQSASVGYVVDRAASGRGVATAALHRLIDVAFGDLDLHRLEAGTIPRNVASQRVLLRCGFVRYGRAPEYLHIDGRWQTHDLFQLINPLHGRVPEQSRTVS